MSEALRQSLGSVIDRVYPGLLDEAGTVIEATQLSGSTESLFVQLSGKTVLESPALQAFVGLESDFRSIMVGSSGLSISTFGGRSRISTAHQVAFDSDDGRFFPDVSVTKTRFGDADTYMARACKLHDPEMSYAAYADLMTVAARKCFDGVLIRSLDARDPVDLTSSAYLLSEKVIAAVNSSVDYFIGEISKLGFSPDIGIFMSGDELAPPNFVPSDYNKVFTHEGFTRAGVGWTRYAEVPGYTQVWMRLAVYGYSGAINLFTYVKGPADRTISWVDARAIPTSNGGWGTASLETVLPNNVSKSGNQTVSTIAINTTGTVLSPIEGISGADLLSACKRDRMDWTVANATSVLLFGVPEAKFYAQGTHTTADFGADESDPREWTLRLNSFKADEFAWLIYKDWYTNYMNTGFYLFNPRNSTIRENVLKEWNALDYDSIILRKTAESYDFDLTVNTLPEALKYARGRAKACKPNDWLQQVAIKDSQITWGAVNSKETSVRGRSLWGSVGRGDSNLNTAGVVKVNEPVSYQYSSTGSTRTDANGVVNLDLNNEDVLSQIVYDRYYNTGASITGGTWDELLALTDTEKAYIQDNDYDVKSDFDFSSNALIGFGSWIDPTGRADVTALNEEQRYRLHLVNSMSLDRMLQPLLRVLNSFGYKSLIKYLK